MTARTYGAAEMTASAQPPDGGGSAGPVGLLVLRAWAEPGSVPPLRVRVTRLDDLEHDEPLSFVTGDVAELEATLRDWLRRFQE